jgi:HK97 family phage portal protein
MLGSLLPDRRAITDIPGGGRWSSPSDVSSLIGSPQMTAMATVAGYACIRLVGDTISTLPLRFFRSRSGVDEQIDPPAWYYEPSALELLPTWLFRGVTSLMLQNRAHLMVTDRDRNGVATSSVWLSPLNVRPQRIGSLQLVNQFGQPYPMSDVRSISGFHLAGADQALSPVDTFRQFFKLATKSEEFGARWFEDGAFPSAVLMNDKPMTDAQALQSVERWEGRHRGRRRTAVLSGGTRWEKISSSAADSQFLETQRFVVDNAGRIWGVPGSMIGGSEGSGLTYNTVEGASLRLHVFTLRPLEVRLEQLISALLLPRGQWCQFVPDALFRAQLLDRYNAHKIALEAGFKTANEVRKLEDLPPLPGGDTLRVNQAANRPGGATA